MPPSTPVTAMYAIIQLLHNKYCAVSYMQYTFLWLLGVITVHALYINCGATEIIVHAGFSALFTFSNRGVCVGGGG